MTKKDIISSWKRWLKLSRIIPLLTILGAGLAIISSTFGIIELTLAENIIIGLLALLAIDALNERIGSLERIESTIGSLSSNNGLKGREEILPPQQLANSASEICIIVVSGVSLFAKGFDFFERKVASGCKLRIILLDPNSPALSIWNLLYKFKTAETEIKVSLEIADVRTFYPYYWHS